jgi:RNA polymerase sigma-70 factor (ECF subfamily)
MQSCDERMLLERAKAYDSAALGDLYDRYAGKIYAYIYYRVGDEVLAEDLTANVFIRSGCGQSTRAWTCPSRAGSIVLRIMHVDHFRRNSHDKGLPWMSLGGATDDPVKTVEQLMASNVVKAAIANLTKSNRL